MRGRVVGLLALCLLLGAVPPSSGVPDQQARFALHATPPPSAWPPPPPVCQAGPNAQNLPCSHYTVASPLGQYTLYVVIGDADPALGIKAASFGLDYSGGPGYGINPATVTWVGCNDGLQFPSDTWPDPGSGIRITDETCRSSPTIPPNRLHVLFGAFNVYAYSEAVFALTENTTLLGGPELAVADCGGHATDFIQLYPSSDWHKLLGKIHLGGSGSQGFTPCCDVCVRATIGSGDGLITLPMASGIYVPVHVQNCSPDPGQVTLYPTIAGVARPAIPLGSIAAAAESLALVPINCTRTDTFLFEVRATLEKPAKYACSESVTVTAWISCDPSEQVGLENPGLLKPHLYPAQPSPFSSRTQIAFDLKRSGLVRLDVFGIRGERVKMLVDAELPAGSHSFVWRGDDANGGSVPPGVYVYRLTTPEGISAGKTIRTR